MGESPWPMVKLGELLTKSDEIVEILPHLVYKQITIRMWGGGVVFDETKYSGAQIHTKKRYVARRWAVYFITD